jgi:hypothetical protein
MEGCGMDSSLYGPLVGFCKFGEWCDTASPPNIITTTCNMMTFSLKFVKWSYITYEFLFPELFCNNFLSAYLYLTDVFFKCTRYILSNSWRSWAVSTLTVLKDIVLFDDNIKFTWKAWQKLQWTSTSTARYYLNINTEYCYASLLWCNTAVLGV